MTVAQQVELDRIVRKFGLSYDAEREIVELLEWVEDEAEASAMAPWATQIFGATP